MEGSSKKRKKYAQFEQAEPQVEPTPEAPKLPFEIWFSHMLKEKKVKFWQEEPILVFMKKQGLSSAETEDAYTKVLAKF